MSWKSLRIRIAAVIVVLTLVLGLGGTARARADLTHIGQMELEKRGVTIARNLAVQHADQVLVNDIYVLYGLVNDLMLNNPDLRYLFILNAKGEAIVSSFAQGLPPGLREANVPQPQEPYRVRRLRTTEGLVYDIAMPVMEGRAGVVRVGMLEGPLWAQVNQQTLGLLVLTGAITLLGAAAGFALGTFLTRPLSELVGVTQAVARGDLQQKALLKGGDEVEKLAQAFNHMTEALARSRDELLRRNEELAVQSAIAVTVSRSLNVEDILNSALNKVLELMKLPAGWIFLVEGDGRLSLAAQQGMPADLFSPEVERELGECVCQEILRSGRARLVEYIADCPRLLYWGTGKLRGHVPRWDVERSPVRHVSVPLRSRERILGVMNLVCHDGCPSSNEELRLLMAIGHQIGVAVENARLYEELQRKEALRGQLLEKVITAQEEERKRVARELHDQYAQPLTALSMSIEAAERVLPPEAGPVREQLEAIKALTARTLDQTYNLILDLRPTALDDLGLVPAIRWYAERHLQARGIRVELEAASVQDRLPAQVETTLFRVMQEALLNVVKHANARRVCIHLAVQDGWLTALVEDDGQGFDLAAVWHSEDQARGLGLLGMQERVALLGGELTIHSQPGQGTRVSIKIPLEKRP